MHNILTKKYLHLKLKILFSDLINPIMTHKALNENFFVTEFQKDDQIKKDIELIHIHNTRHVENIIYHKPRINKSIAKNLLVYKTTVY